MSPHDLVCSFISNVRVPFDIYFNNISKLRKSLINDTKYAKYLYFFANLQQKIVEKNKVKKAQLYKEKQ